MYGRLMLSKSTLWHYEILGALKYHNRSETRYEKFRLIGLFTPVGFLDL